MRCACLPRERCLTDVVTLRIIGSHEVSILLQTSQCRAPSNLYASFNAMMAAKSLVLLLVLVCASQASAQNLNDLAQQAAAQAAAAHRRSDRAKNPPTPSCSKSKRRQVSRCEAKCRILHVPIPS